ncbi:amidase [Paenibacillus oleatilyticus]|uniref:amidase n=1 Tax=Paenibacillus oleatilyticus TaxID=2594886 RepID=UPI001C1F966C|nr:amidase family protein [Paenibacillus oleatilyticus]MBU7314964.1 amidase [Paenibacillus oleatilyticus]
MKLSEYASYDGLGLAELVKRGEVTPRELTALACEAIRLVNPQLNVMAVSMQEQAERESESVLPDGSFPGVPFLIKDSTLHTAGVPLNSGSRLGEGMIYPYDSELMRRFRQAGLVTLGSTTAPEFGFNATTEAVLYGPTRNPWNPERSPGGSSGGSAAAVAAGIVPFAHANDGGGSIRIPASCNGLVGLKPTRGRTPNGPDSGEVLSGLGIQFAVTKTVRDAAALLDAVAGPDPGAYAWAERPGRPFSVEAAAATGRLRIAWTAKPLSGTPVDKECLRVLHETVSLCEELGHELVEASPEVDYEALFVATMHIWVANTYHGIERLAKALNRTPSEHNLEATILKAYRHGASLSAHDLLTAVDISAKASRSVGRFFEQYDVLLSPTIASPPLPLGVLNANDPEIDVRRWTEQVFTHAPFTSLFNTTGQPAISLPLGWSADGLPIGMQFAGRFADEATLLQLAGQLETARPWNHKRPGIHAASVQ